MLWIALRSIIGWLWWLFIPIRKNLAVANFQHCFPERTPGELRSGIGDIVVQYLYLFFGKRAHLALPEDIKGGGICLAGHGSAWDIALLSLAENVPVTIFLRKPSNRLLAKWITSQRARAGIEALYGRNCMNRAYKSLEAGRLVVFVQDQRHNDGINSLFFNRPCLSSAAFASMLHRTRAPLFGAWQRNDGSAIAITLERLNWTIPEDREAAIPLLTQQSQYFYEEKISINPASWLWLHDRWKIPAS